MSKPWIFISPSSRGIGHALTAYLLRTTTLPILATARSDLAGVKESLVAASMPSANTKTSSSCEDHASRLHVAYLDVTDEPSVKAASEKAAEIFPPSSHHLHLAFALPGILHPEKHPRQIDYDDALETFKVNTLGPLMLMKWFGELLPRKGTDLSRLKTQTTRGGFGTGSSSMNGGEREFRVPAHATWLTNSARVGSTSDNRLGGWYSYRASKAGVNSITKSFDLHLRTRSAHNAAAIAYHPGTVKTGLSREFWGNVAEDKLFSPEFAARKMLEVIASRTVEHRGKCWDWKAEEVLP
ncbi:short-chain dehydrogenase/reductase-like protein [Ustulina deusta]|nr:short-chain dehydrogenase/reductase-like protein [Ustulina deusta]KAI3328255.1 short-chain dehydrogenase/reductase-like protein [Ustulina deusta]